MYCPQRQNAHQHEPVWKSIIAVRGCSAATPIRVLAAAADNNTSPTVAATNAAAAAIYAADTTAAVTTA
eukprot:6197489-Pleurochrysis_carterae.AAC.1